MEIRNSQSCTIDLYYHELGTIMRALESYISGDLNDRVEFCRAKSLYLAISQFLH